MKSWLTCIVIVSLLTGGSCMARERPSVNQDKIDTIKQEMNYAQFLHQLPRDKLVVLDWQALLSEFKDAEGMTWRADKSITTCSTEHGDLTTRIRSDNGSIRVTIHSLSQGQEDAIDLALWEATNSNAPFVYYKYDPHCFANFCLIPRQGNTVESILFVYGNIMVDLTHSTDNHDVLPVARYLHSAMEKAMVANPERKLPARPKTIFTVNPAQIKVGDTFEVTVPTDYPNAQWDFYFSEDLLTPNIVYDKRRMNVITFKAIAPGKGTISFSLMDKKTLWVFTDTVTVNIDPKNDK